MTLWGALIRSRCKSGKIAEADRVCAPHGLLSAELTPGWPPIIGPPSDRISSGLVIGTEPPEGESVPEGTQVDLIVAPGHEPPGVVPNVSGLGFIDAANVFARDGYTASELEEPSDTVESGIAIRTVPAAGVPLNPGADVTVIVSSGREPLPPPDPPAEFLGPE
jgi:eukaryotic-like serine/threonine-protein kinase